MQGRKVLVTGGAGFIGSPRVERLSGRNTVTVLDDLSTGSIRNLEDSPEEFHVHKGSILQPKALAGAMEAQDIVYHLAARTSPAESVQQPGASPGACSCPAHPPRKPSKRPRGSRRCAPRLPRRTRRRRWSASSPA